MDLSKYAAGTRKYMSKDLWDAGKGEDLTIASIRETQFQERDGSTKTKLVVDWVEDRPPLTLNKTNMAFLLGTYGPRDEHWAGKQVHVFHDPTVKYAGKFIGGVVLDEPKGMKGPDPSLQKQLKMADIKSAKGLKEEISDDVPF